MTAADCVTCADELAFFRRICGEPGEDAPRLVYADWLEENGEPDYASFIRIQCELARIPDPPDAEMIGLRASVREQKLRALLEWKKRWTATYYALRRREAELFAEVRSAIRATLPDGWDVTLPDPKSVVYQEQTGGYGVVRRGFVESITCTSAAFLGGTCGTCQEVRGPNGMRRAVYEHAGPSSGWVICPACCGTGKTPGAAAGLRWQPVERVTISDAVIHESGGNMTYYVGWLGQWLREYWSRLGNLPSRKAALDALSAAAVAYLRGLREGTEVCR